MYRGSSWPEGLCRRGSGDYFGDMSAISAVVRRLWRALGRLLRAWRGRPRPPPEVGLPPWAEVDKRRRAHIRRVAALVQRWAEELEDSKRERARWLRAVWLHDALRDARLPKGTTHGAAAADRAARQGEADAGVLDAVRYHSVGYARWDDAGRMLYLADYLEPGRTFDREARRELAARVPAERDVVLRDVARRRIESPVRSGWPLREETVNFWN